jgi:hypothetical protein
MLEISHSYFHELADFVKSNQTLKKIRTNILAIMLLVLPVISLNAQDDCRNTLKQAKQLYEQGLIDQIPKILSSCMQSGFTRPQRIEAYKLIILSYLFDDNQFEAEKSMDDFLSKFPEYELMPNDPVEFVYLFESYKTSLLYSLDFFIGPTFSMRSVQERYTTLDQSQTTLTERPGSGFEFGIGLSRNLRKSLSLNVDLVYANHKYDFTRISNTQLGTEVYQFVKINVIEKTNQVCLPVSLSYGFGKGNLSYYLRLGGDFGIVTKSSISLERSSDAIDVTENNYNIMKHRNQFYYAALGGVGIEYKVPRGYLVLDIRYHAGLNNMTIGSKRYSDPAIISKYYYIDDDFTLNYLSVCLGYNFSIYQSRKKKD